MSMRLQCHVYTGDTVTVKYFASTNIIRNRSLINFAWCIPVAKSHKNYIYFLLFEWSISWFQCMLSIEYIIWCIILYITHIILNMPLLLKYSLDDIIMWLHYDNEVSYLWHSHHHTFRLYLPTIGNVRIEASYFNYPLRTMCTGDTVTYM